MSLPESIRVLLASMARTARIHKAGPGARAMLAHATLGQRRSPVLVARDQRELAELAALVRLLAQEEAGPVWERTWISFPSYEAGPYNPKAWAGRMASLFALAQGQGPRGVLLTLDSFLSRWPRRELLEEHHVRLKVGEEWLPEMLLEQAVAWGYERCSLVTRPGEMARRGDILDLYAPGYDSPMRLEFFGDTLEEIRLFDPMTQRARQNLESATVLPVSPVIRSEGSMRQAKEHWDGLEREERLSAPERRLLERALDEGGRYAGIRPALYYARTSNLEDWLPDTAVFLLPSEREVLQRLEDSAFAWEEHLLQAGEAEATFSLQVRRPEAVAAKLELRPRMVFEDLVLGVEKSGVELPERTIGGFQELFPSPSAMERPWQTLVAALREWGTSRNQVILSFGSEQARRKFLKLAEEEGVVPRTGYSPRERGVFALVSSFAGGLELQWNDALILAENILQPRPSTRPKVPPRAFIGLESFDDLEPGVLLVHRDYGLGRFEGLVRLDVGLVANDYLLLRYAGEDKLYLPVDRLGLVQRFKGPDGTSPALDRLGGVGWIRSREKARKAVEAIARDLVEMYAYRRIAKGYSYTAPGELFREFEASFGFEETPDQARAIQDVLEDMERPEPMDRLVCGDVGFGKTEVAMRAAFRATLDGKQVAMLCPTTVLAEQHYQNFVSRLEGFPINVAMLSRFVPAKRQKRIIEAAAKGQIDILIGTHRLLSKDLKLPNLGLLVLDEEQRFGVRHKERLKALRKNVDVLTLTATPIPRTLQLSLSGIRELSVIETAPVDRKPVATALVERDPKLLREVLAREIERGGQIFWVHNRVRGLEDVVRYVQELSPGARIGMAHGQMAERQLEETMHQFWHRELDILVCTAIIESGLDFPQANTLVVDQAQMFGLGQLYQLRGRVGRSERQAFAYFVIPDLDRLQEASRKRLKIIMDMDYLGAGFQIAMEDLRLRGAGNILGEAQSGTIAKVGLDLFLEMLEDEVRRLRGEPLPEETDPELSIGLEANIPERYMEDPKDRLRYYKALSSTPSRELRLDLAVEIRDRFGPLPETLENFLAVLDLKQILAGLQVERGEIASDRLKLVFREDTSTVRPDQLVRWVGQRGGRARMIPPASLEFRIDGDGSIRDRLDRARGELALLTQSEDEQEIYATS